MSVNELGMFFYSYDKAFQWYLEHFKKNWKKEILSIFKLVCFVF